MRCICVLVISLLLTTTVSVDAASTRGVISCSNSSLDSLPGNWSMSDQTCLRVDLGVLAPGDSLFFEISSDSEVDILLFPSNTVSVYQNEQSYRIDSVWMSESVFESFSGEGEWHWKVPADRDSTRWYLVIDNLAHPQDSGEGSQGGQSSEVSLDGGLISPQQFTLSDSIHRVEPGEFSIAHGPFSVDEGTFVEIHARTMVGEPDIFVMTETAFSYYSPSSNWSSSLRTVSADMLLVSNERYLPWEASDTNGEDLYIVVDNRPGPGGGGAGSSHAAVTVTVTLIPLLEPSIFSQTDLDSVDVGAQITLSASGTPNKSGQIPESGYSWDIDGDGVNDRSGVTTEHHWEEPGNYTVRLSVTSVDSRSASVTRTVSVTDMSAPSVSLGVSGEVTKGFGEQLTISATFTDNWGVESLDWMIDGAIIISNYSLTDVTSTLNFQVSNEYSPGQHEISLVVRDKSGMTTQEDALVNFIDVTAPEISQYAANIEVNIGDSTILQIFAQDNESDKLEYTWTIEQGTESEVQFSGPLVVHEFNSEGPTNVVCRVENDAGLASYADILVIVKESETGDGLAWQAIVFISVILLILISVASFFLYNSAVSRRMSEFSEEEEEKPVPQPHSPQMQAQMWGRVEKPSFNPPQEITTNTLPATEMYDLLDENQSPSEDIQIPVELENSLLGELQSTPEQNNQEPPAGTTIRKGCSKCSNTFEITLPEGLETAYTNCPHCGSEEMVGIR
ncbi:MAG TPA: PKD domain-containing protein [Candidatus Thalassarchaeaceae archaeon]|nr:PKD domain-containing protein [Candidatus Thalassarchaeaceae archaeon]